VAAGLARISAGGEDWTFQEAVHSAGFWGLATSMALIGLMPSTVFVFLFATFHSQGLSDTAAAATISVMGLTQVVTRVAFWTPFIARLGSVQRALLLWGGLLTCAALWLSVAQGALMAYLASGFLGVAMGGNLVLQLLIWPEYFGRTAVGAISGTANLLHGISGAAGPLLGAMLVDLTGGYFWLYLAMAGCALAGLLLQMMVGKPRRPAGSVP
jgi:MFS family permease